jgi:beta-lactamase regulating signal transducer with metallopeptidase domain
MMPIAIPSSERFLIQLVSPAARSFALAGGAALALTAFRVKTVSARLFTWKAVLCAALAMPLLTWILPAYTFPLPSFPQEIIQKFAVQSKDSSSHNLQSPFAPGHQKVILSSVPAERVTRKAAIQNDQTPAAESSSPLHPTTYPISWTAIAVAPYLAVTVLLLARILIGWLLGHRLLRISKEILDPRLALCLGRHAHSFGLTSIPNCAESEIVAAPVTMGALRPTILLPGSWREWDNAKLDTVVAHEMSHVARHDGFTQHLSLLHRAIFWFSPLAWWLDRHLTELAEQASDEAALSCGADRNDYAKTLLGFFEILHTAPGRIWWQGVAMAKPGQAERRLERILAWNKSKGAVTMGLKKSAVMAIIAFAIPAVFLAASARPGNDKTAVQEAQPAQTPQPAPSAKPSAGETHEINPPEAAAEVLLSPSHGATIAPHGVVILKNGLTSIAPLAPVAPVAPVSPLAALTARSAQTAKSGYSYAYGYDDDDRYVIVSGKTDSLTMSGSSQDAHHVERLRKEITGDFIWFQRDEKSYIIRDQATIDRARSFWAPQEDIGKKQEELGKKQEALGKQQEALGEKMEQIHVTPPDMSADLEKLKAELKQLSSTGATMDQLGNIQSEIGDLQSKIGDIQSRAGEQQSKLGEEMSVLGEQQGKLGEQQGELGRQQEEASRQATRKMKELLDESVKNGQAQPEPQITKDPTL